MTTVRNQNKHSARQQEFVALGQPVTLKYKIINYSLAALFLVGITLLVFEISLYRQTLIKWTIPTSIWLITGLLFTPITSRILIKYFGTRPFFLQLVFNVVVFGSITIYIFIASNYYCSLDTKPNTFKAPILKTGHFPFSEYGPGSTHANVQINGFDKELIFSPNLDIEKYKYVIITIKKGLWGFDIIENKTTVKN